MGMIHTAGDGTLSDDGHAFVRNVCTCQCRAMICHAMPCHARQATFHVVLAHCVYIPVKIFLFFPLAVVQQRKLLSRRHP